MTLKGRHWLTAGLLAFLVSAAIVQARTTAGFRAARGLEEARTARAAAEARRGELERRIRTARSREVLVPRAERLGLRLPSDSEIVLLPAPGPAPR